MLYRIVHKLPIIDISVGEHKDLSSLFENNKNAIKKKKIEDLDDLLETVLSEKSVSDIKEMDSDDVLDLLITEEDKKDEPEDK